MPYIMPTGFSTLVFGIINLTKKITDFFKKALIVLGILNKSVETQMNVETMLREE